MKKLNDDCEVVLQKLKRYNLFPDERRDDDYVKNRKKIKRGISCNNDTIKLLITLVNEMNGSMVKQQKKIKELTDKVESLKAVERPPMPDRSYQLLTQQNQELKDELEFYKRKCSHA